MHDPDGLEKLGVRADGNFVALVVDVGHGRKPDELLTLKTTFCLDI